MRTIISNNFNVINKLLARRYRFLLICLIGMIIVPSFFEDSALEDFLDFVLRSLVVFAGIYAIQESRAQLIVGVVAGTVVIIINLLGVFRNATTT